MFNVKMRPQSEKIVDGGNVTAYCSSCGVGLLNFGITSPTKDTYWNVRVDCPHCGDKSYVEKIYSNTFYTSPEWTHKGKTTKFVGNDEAKTRDGEPLSIFLTVKVEK